MNRENIFFYSRFRWTCSDSLWRETEWKKRTVWKLLSYLIWNFYLYRHCSNIEVLLNDFDGRKKSLISLSQVL